MVMAGMNPLMSSWVMTTTVISGTVRAHHALDRSTVCSTPGGTAPWRACAVSCSSAASRLPHAR